MLAVSSWIVLLIYMAPCIFAQKCHTNISDAHYKFIDELISTQANLCKIPVKILNKDIVTDTCDFWALVHELNGLLEKFIFTPNTENYKKTYELKQTYIGCLDDIQGDEKNVLDIYLQTSYMNAEEILTKVKDSLKKLKVLKASEYPWDCISYYETHGQQNNDVLKAEGRNEKLSQSNIAVIIIAILGVLVLLLLCGLLYYQHQCRVLERRLNINYDIDLSRNAGAVLPEERVQLHTIEGEIV